MRFTAAIGLIKRELDNILLETDLYARSWQRRGGSLVVHTVSNSVRMMCGRSWRIDRDGRNILSKSWCIHHIGDVFSFRIARYGIRQIGVLSDARLPFLEYLDFLTTRPFHSAQSIRLDFAPWPYTDKSNLRTLNKIMRK